MKYIFTNKNFTCFVGEQVYTIDKTHPFYQELKEAIKNNDEESFLEHVTKNNHVEAAISKMNSDLVTYVDGKVIYNGEELHNTLCDRIVQLAEEGFELTPMLTFLSNLMQNSSRSSIEELYDFLENKNLPITEDGFFLAYKAVCGDFMDKHSRSVNNSVGQVIRMERNKVDDDRRNECSYGYHVGSLEYSGPNGSFWSNGDRTVIVKVNPRDVVAVPKDYSCQKMRVCEYTVVGEYVAPLSKALYNENGDSCTGCCCANFIETEDIVAGDMINFTYRKTCGDVSSRENVYVDSVHCDYILGYEDSFDGDYEDDEENIKRFNFDGMTNVELLDDM